MVVALILLASTAPVGAAESESESPGGWLGFWFIHQESDEGDFLFVQRVLPDGPADEGGLEERDRVLAIDGQPIERFTLRAVAKFLLKLTPGQRVELEIHRSGESLQLELEAEELPEKLRKARERLRQRAGS